MVTFVCILAVVAFVYFIVGLVNPSLVLRCNAKPTRWKVFGWYMFFSIVVVVLFAIFGGDGSSTTKDNQQETNENVEQNITEQVEKQNADSIRKAIQDKIEIEKKKFNTKYDDFEKITWFYSKTKPQYANTKALYTYIGLDEDAHAWRRLVIRYHGDSWLFVNSIIVKTDDNTYTIEADNIKRDNDSDVWEWIDINVTDKEDIIINDIISSKQTKIRFNGDQYHYDWIVPSKSIQGLKEINEFYALLDSLSKLN